jgi:hypothetical protein
MQVVDGTATARPKLERKGNGLFNVLPMLLTAFWGFLIPARFGRAAARPRRQASWASSSGLARSLARGRRGRGRLSAIAAAGFGGGG